MTSRPVVVVAALLLAAVAPAQGIEDLLVESFPGPTLSVHFIDVGQGDAILIQTPRGKHVLVDSGPDAQARALTAYLDDLAVGRLDMVVNSHAHADHIAGLPALLTRWPVGLVLDSGIAHTSGTYARMLSALEAQKLSVKKARRGRKVTIEPGVSLELLGPQEPLVTGSRSDLNANSVVFRLAYGRISFLLTGDAERETEARLLVAPREVRATVLKVAHHGSAHATTAAMLKAVNPRVAVVSCGRHNKYGHPAPETMARLERAGVQTYVTARDGDVVISTDGRKLRIETYPKRPASAKTTTSEAKPLPVQPGATSTLLLDVNTASHEQLRSLPGVGPKTAEKIIAARPFASVPELRRVKGIGAKKLARLLPLVRAGPSGHQAVATPATPLPTTPGPAVLPASADHDGLIDLNTASAEALDTLPGIGPKTAARILEWRGANGPFLSIDQVTQVKGIGPKKLQKLRPLVTVGIGPEEPPN